jgi:DNA-binding MarR family transcriptional regulator
MRIEEEIKSGKFQNPGEQAFLNIIFSAGWVRNRVSTSLKPFRLTYEQYLVLRIVRDVYPEGLRVKDVTLRMPDPSSNTTRILDKLVPKKLVLRTSNDSDGRARNILISQEGLDLMSKIDKAWEGNSPYHTSLQGKEAAQLNDLLEKLRTLS